MTNIFDPSRWSMYPPQTFVSGDYYAFKSDDMSVSFPLSSYAIKFCASQFGNGTRPHRLNKFHWMQWSQDRNTRSPQEQLQHHHGLSKVLEQRIELKQMPKCQLRLIWKYNDQTYSSLPFLDLLNIFLIRFTARSSFSNQNIHDSRKSDNETWRNK